MKEHGIYFGKSCFFELVRNISGAWNDSKERPLVCLVKSIENENLYWAIPITDNYIEREYRKIFQRAICNQKQGVTF